VEDAFDAAPARFRDIAHLIKVLVPEVVDHSVNRVEAGFDERVSVLLEIDLFQPFRAVFARFCFCSRSASSCSKALRISAIA
jgi:hypothetical protein